METIDYTLLTTVVVVVLRDRIMGLVVDFVSALLTISEKDIQVSPEAGTKVDLSFLIGIAKYSDKLVALLDRDCLLADGGV